MANFYTTSATGAYGDFTNPPTNVSLDNIRRTFDLSGMIAELRPLESPFFTYLTKVRRVPTPDPIFKMMEQRHQWQRRNFYIYNNGSANYSNTQTNLLGTGVVVKCNYDARGKESSAAFPQFLITGQIVAIETATEGTSGYTGTLYARVSAYTASTGTLKLTPMFILDSTNGKQACQGSTYTITLPLNARAQVVGTAYAEGSDSPDGWNDILGQTEGYAQIFKTACPLMSGTAMATEFRGKKNEFARIWDEKMREHKMDMEHSFLFGVGHVATSTGALSAEDASTPKRYTWGALPFVSLYGNTAAFSYASSGYNDFVDWCQDFFAPEKGNSTTKLVLASRKIVGWFNKLGGGNSFLGNTLVAEAARLDVQAVKSQFGFNLTRVNTVFGDLNFVAHPLLRGQWEDYVIVIDLPNLAYRPLQGNGISRDTFYQTNIQDNGVDGRIDQMITEAGLQILLPETHAVLKWS